MENKLIEGDEINGGTITVNEEAAKNETANQANFMQVADENGKFPETPAAELSTNAQGDYTVLDVSDEKPVTLEDLKKQQDEFVAKKENQESAFILAKEIESIMGANKWFTLEKIARKVRQPELALYQKLKLLDLFGFLERKQGDPLVSEQRGAVVFKITISVDKKVEAIDDAIKGLQAEISKLEFKKKILLSEAPKAETTSELDQKQ